MIDNRMLDQEMIVHDMYSWALCLDGIHCGPTGDARNQKGKLDDRQLDG